MLARKYKCVQERKRWAAGVCWQTESKISVGLMYSVAIDDTRYIFKSVQGGFISCHAGKHGQLLVIKCVFLFDYLLYIHTHKHTHTHRGSVKQMYTHFNERKLYVV